MAKLINLRKALSVLWEGELYLTTAMIVTSTGTDIYTVLKLYVAPGHPRGITTVQGGHLVTMKINPSTILSEQDVVWG
jgi:hypothetical protein